MVTSFLILCENPYYSSPQKHRPSAFLLYVLASASCWRALAWSASSGSLRELELSWLKSPEHEINDSG